MASGPVAVAFISTSPLARGSVPHVIVSPPPLPTAHGTLGWSVVMVAVAVRAVALLGLPGPAVAVRCATLVAMSTHASNLTLWSASLVPPASTVTVPVLKSSVWRKKLEPAPWAHGLGCTASDTCPSLKGEVSSAMASCLLSHTLIRPVSSSGKAAAVRSPLPRGWAPFTVRTSVLSQPPPPCPGSTLAVSHTSLNLLGSCCCGADATAASSNRGCASSARTAGMPGSQPSGRPRTARCACIRIL